MAPLLKWITGLALAGALASCSPHSTRDDSESADTDIASQFVSDLIADVSQADQEQQASQRRSLTCAQDSSLVVNLGYAKYRGYNDPATGLNYWKGYGYSLTSQNAPVSD